MIEDNYVPRMKNMKKRGWLRDRPSVFDYHMGSESIYPMLTTVLKDNKTVPEVDLRSFFNNVKIEDQGDVGSCTGNACASLIEGFAYKTFGKYTDVSRMFLYWAARWIGGLFPGDNGAELRNVMGGLVLFGAPPEEFWPYELKRVDMKPTAECFAFANNFKAVKYYRIDTPKKEKTAILNDIKLHLTNNLPLMFGFTCYASLDQATGGKIPYPGKNDKMDGGHAIVACGFHDKMKIVNPLDKSTTTGAILVRNSWGDWGENGYGWLPYEYVLSGLASDFWVLIQNSWVDTDIFI
jgi:C1A family cysteine protease